MVQLIDKVTKSLHQAFPGCEAKIEPGSAARRIGGVLIWNGFDGVDQIDRQRMVREALDKAVPGPDRRSVSLILTLTPTEMQVMKAG